MSKAKQKKRKVKIVESSYQPSRSELNEDVRVLASFTDAVDALLKPVEIEYVEKP